MDADQIADPAPLTACASAAVPATCAFDGAIHFRFVGPPHICLEARLVTLLVSCGHQALDRHLRLVRQEEASGQ